MALQRRKVPERVGGEVTRPRSDDREGAGVSTQRARRCGDEWSASRRRQPVTMLLPARRCSDLIEYLSTRRGVWSPKSPTLAPHPPHPPTRPPHVELLQCFIQQQRACACVLHNSCRDDTVASRLSKVNPRSAVLGSLRLKKLPSCDTERKKITDNSATHSNHREPTLTLIRVQCAAVHGGARPGRARDPSAVDG